MRLSVVDSTPHPTRGSIATEATRPMPWAKPTPAWAGSRPMATICVWEPTRSRARAPTAGCSALRSAKTTWRRSAPAPAKLGTRQRAFSRSDRGPWASTSWIEEGGPVLPIGYSRQSELFLWKRQAPVRYREPPGGIYRLLTGPFEEPTIESARLCRGIVACKIQQYRSLSVSTEVVVRKRTVGGNSLVDVDRILVGLQAKRS